MKLTTKLRNRCYVMLVTNNIFAAILRVSLFPVSSKLCIFMHFMHTLYATFTILHRLPLLHADTVYLLDKNR